MENDNTNRSVVSNEVSNEEVSNKETTEEEVVEEELSEEEKELLAKDKAGSFEQRCMADYNSGDPVRKQQAMADMCEKLRKWVRCCVAKFGLHPVDQEDMEQVGMLAICKNMDKYNPKYAPITFFTNYIRGDMHEYAVAQYGWKKNDITVKNKIEAAKNQLKKEGKRVTVENIVRVAGDRITREVIFKNQQVMEATKEQVRLDKQIDDKDGNCFLDGLLQNTETPEKIYEENEMKEVVNKAINEDLLSDERIVIKSLIWDEMSVADVADMMGITTNAVRKLRTSAYLQLQQSKTLCRYMGKDMEKPKLADFGYSDDVDFYEELTDAEIDFEAMAS